MVTISRILSLLFMVLAVAIVAPAAQSSSVGASTNSLNSSIEAARLTPERFRYDVYASGSRVTVRNVWSGRNNREIFWNPDVPVSSHATQCATWVSGADIGQNGLVFRVDQRPDGSFNAIVLERNIWAYAFWKFVPIMFHNGDEYEEDFQGVEGIDLSGCLGVASEAVWPLRICASLSDDNILRFAVAKGTDVMPPLESPGLQGGSWKLDIPRYFHAGQGAAGINGGIYAARVPLDSELVFDDVTLDGLPLQLSNGTRK